ncbi:MAG: hypothetical protein NZ455_07925 [Bacteroidia bacterium]|nr:hypothetical protein [Bacteroidia bacterium]MDW8345688.1 hypothetical protein [Bacteroidia bacterium]
MHEQCVTQKHGTWHPVGKGTLKKVQSKFKTDSSYKIKIKIASASELT